MYNRLSIIDGTSAQPSQSFYVGPVRNHHETSAQPSIPLFRTSSFWFLTWVILVLHLLNILTIRTQIYRITILWLYFSVENEGLNWWLLTYDHHYFPQQWLAVAPCCYWPVIISWYTNPVVAGCSAKCLQRFNLPQLQAVDTSLCKAVLTASKARSKGCHIQIDVRLWNVILIQTTLKSPFKMTSLWVSLSLGGNKAPFTRYDIDCDWLKQ